MDPIANLKEQEELLALKNYPARYTQEHRNRLIELRTALKIWIRGGGFIGHWEDYPNAAQYFIALEMT